MIYKSPLRYPGGKSSIALTLVSLFPDRITHYFEPFLGGGSVMLATLATYEKSLRLMVCNDVDAHLMTFWQALTDPFTTSGLHNEATELYAFSRKDPDGFRRFLAKVKAVVNLPARHPNIEMVASPAAFYALNRCSFSGTPKGGLSPDFDRFTCSQIDELLRYTNTVENINFVCSDWQELFNRETLGHLGVFDYDAKPFMFLDPPYHSVKGLYSQEAIDYVALKNALVDLPMPFLMTIDDTPYTRELFGRFGNATLPMVYSMTNGGESRAQTRKNELLVFNYANAQTIRYLEAGNSIYGRN